MGNNEEFERLAKEFEEDTGFLPPGKDDTMRMLDSESLWMVWNAWLSGRKRGHDGA